MHIKWNIIYASKRPFICYSMVEPGGHAEWNKPDTEEQIWYDRIYMSNLK